MFIGTLLILASYGFYLFNLRQIRLEDEAEKQRDRQRRIDKVNARRAERRKQREKTD